MPVRAAYRMMAACRHEAAVRRRRRGRIVGIVVRVLAVLWCVLASLKSRRAL